MFNNWMPICSCIKREMQNTQILEQRQSCQLPTIKPILENRTLTTNHKQIWSPSLPDTVKTRSLNLSRSDITDSREPKPQNRATTGYSSYLRKLISNTSYSEERTTSRVTQASGVRPGYPQFLRNTSPGTHSLSRNRVLQNTPRNSTNSWGKHS